VAGKVNALNQNGVFIRHKLVIAKINSARLPSVPHHNFCACFSRLPSPSHLLRRDLQNGFQHRSSHRIDQLIDGNSRLRNQIDHGQQLLPVLAEKGGQFFFPDPGLRIQGCDSVTSRALLRGRCLVCEREVEMLTASQAAEFLELGDSALEALVSAGKIHAVEVLGGKMLLCKESLP
jgi:excisionase family DNA binding protein